MLVACASIKCGCKDNCLRTWDFQQMITSSFHTLLLLHAVGKDARSHYRLHFSSPRTTYGILREQSSEQMRRSDTFLHVCSYLPMS
jgi:hypothetical protein